MKLKINGKLANLNGYTKGTIRIDGITWPWNNAYVPISSLSRDFTTQEAFDEFDTAYKEGRVTTNPYAENTLYRRPQNMYYSNLTGYLYMSCAISSSSYRAGLIKSMNLATKGKYRVDVDIKAFVESGHGSITQRQSIMSIFFQNNDNTDYLGPILFYEPDGTYSLDIQYRDADNNKVTSTNVLTNIDTSDFIKYSAILDFDNKVVKTYVNGTLIETWTDNPQMNSFGAVGIPGTNNNTLRMYSPLTLKAITVSEAKFNKDFTKQEDYEAYHNAASWPGNTGYLPDTLYKRTNTFAEEQVTDGLRLYNTGTSSSNRYGLYATTEFFNSGKYELNVNLNVRVNATISSAGSDLGLISFYLNNYEGSTSDFGRVEVKWVYSTKDYVLTVNPRNSSGTSEYTRTPITVNEFHNIKMVFDVDNNSMDVYLDNSLIAENVTVDIGILNYINMAGGTSGDVKLKSDVIIKSITLNEVE